jgi:aspartate aminotransferase-like enzyme
MPFDPEECTFLIPGPVAMHPRVLRALGKPVLSHRSGEFQKLLASFKDDLKKLFQTKGDVAVLTGSGTAGMEAAVACSVRKGDKVVALDNGKFGNRFASLSKMYGDATVVTAPWGQPFDLAALERTLAQAKPKAVAFVLNETSAGMLNEGKEICRLAKQHGATIIMDAITAVGGMHVPIDEWGVDFTIVGSQKCIAGPTGLAFVSVSPEARSRLIKGQSYYLDLQKHLDKLVENETPYTPAVPLFLACAEAVKMVHEEGLENRIKRHAKLAEASQKAARALGLELYPDPKHSSPTCTAIRYPPGIGDKEIRTVMKDKFGVIVAGGQEPEAKGKILRIGHMGNVSFRELASCFMALEGALAKTSFKFHRGAAVSAVAEVAATL